MADLPATKEINWLALVERVDDDNRQQDSLYPVVYFFSMGKTKRDSGPDGGVYG